MAICRVWAEWTVIKQRRWCIKTRIWIKTTFFSIPIRRIGNWIIDWGLSPFHSEFNTVWFFFSPLFWHVWRELIDLVSVLSEQVHLEPFVCNCERQSKEWRSFKFRGTAVFLSRWLENCLSTGLRITDRLWLTPVLYSWNMAIAPFMYRVVSLQWTHLMHSPCSVGETLPFQAALGEGRALPLRARVKLSANLTSRVFPLSQNVSKSGERGLKGKGSKNLLISYPFSLSLLPTPPAGRTNTCLLEYLFILGVHLWRAGRIMRDGVIVLWHRLVHSGHEEVSCWISWRDLDFTPFKH